jgi:SAM-dependent methyltransferase
MGRRSLVRRIYGHPLLYVGHRLECPICGGKFRRMRHGRGRRDVQCPRCASYERVRALWLFLTRETDLMLSPQRVLHFAPERALTDRLRALEHLDYTSGDLAPGVGMEHIDITAIPKPDDSFDTVICSHVLEHVPDDRRAMSELRRVLKPGGTAILMQPVDYTRESTYEDWSITTEEGREAAFNQFDHVRIYGPDIRQRLESVGFAVTLRRYTEEVPVEERRRFSLGWGDATEREDDIYVCS